MQKFIVKLVFLAGWALAFVHSTNVDLRKHLTWHTFFRLHAAELHAPGFKPLDLDRDVSNFSLLAKTSRDSGYQLRAFFDQWPKFILAESSPKNPNKRNLVLRNEVALEFQGNHSYSFLSLQAAHVTGYAERYSKLLGFRPLVMIVPTKIFANDIEVGVSQASSWALKMLDIDDGSKLVGSQFFQLMVEGLLRDRGTDLVSLIPLFNRLKQNSTEPLFPYGESHWSRSTVEEVGQYLVSEIANQKIIPRSCFRPIKDWPAPKEKVYFGDLHGTTNLPENADSPYATKSYENRVGQLTAASDLSECPAILYAGTSYGVIYAQDGDIAQVIKLVYRGPVRNYSVGGKGPFASLKELEKDRGLWPKNSILLWEFPFQHILVPDLLMGPQ